MRATKNIRKPLRRYEKSIEQPIIKREEPETEIPPVYADITAAHAHFPIQILNSSIPSKQENIEKTDPEKKFKIKKDK